MVGNCKGSSTVSQNFMNFGPQRPKMGPEFYPPSVNSTLWFTARHRTGMPGNQTLLAARVRSGLEMLYKF